MSYELDNMLDDLCDAPDGQIAEDQTEKLKALVGKPVKEIEEGLKKVLDDCCAYSLASDFAMLFLDVVWKEAKRLQEVKL